MPRGMRYLYVHAHLTSLTLCVPIAIGHCSCSRRPHCAKWGINRHVAFAIMNRLLKVDR